MFPDPRLCRLSFEYPGSAGARPWQEMTAKLLLMINDHEFGSQRIKNVEFRKKWRMGRERLINLTEAMTSREKIAGETFLSVGCAKD